MANGSVIKSLRRNIWIKRRTLFDLINLCVFMSFRNAVCLNGKIEQNKKWKCYDLQAKFNWNERHFFLFVYSTVQIVSFLNTLFLLPFCLYCICFKFVLWLTDWLYVCLFLSMTIVSTVESIQIQTHRL